MFLTSILHGQTTTVISKFTWDNLGQDPKVADIGPNAISISSSAKIDANGVGGTNGLNASTPKLNIEMEFANNSIFDVDGIDLSIDYQRDEDIGTFFLRAGAFSFLSASHLHVNFKLKDPANAANNVTINSGEVQEIPEDNVFRNYRFKYDPNTGLAELFIDGNQVWSYAANTGLLLDWSGAGNIFIAEDMDGNGSDRTFYDNYILKGITFSTLPIKLLSFSVKENESNPSVNINWKTASETNNNHFTLERSTNGLTWDIIEITEGAGNSNSTLAYSSIDKTPPNGVLYYRLKQTDFDGNFSYSHVESVKFNFRHSFNVYPNPIRHGELLHFDILSSNNENSEILIYASNGFLIQKLKNSELESNQTLLMELKPGIYFIIFESEKWKLIVTN